jgi:hypothetical protein
MKIELPPVAVPRRILGLSYKVMQREAVRLINVGCFQQGIRGPRELSLLAGVSEEKASLVYCGDGERPNLVDDEILALNGKEWDDLLSVADVSLETWVETSIANNPKKINEKDLVVGLVPQYGASSTGHEPSLETQRRIGTILGYSSAFYLKASNIVLPVAHSRQRRGKHIEYPA